MQSRIPGDLSCMGACSPAPGLSASLLEVGVDRGKLFILAPRLFIQTMSGLRGIVQH